MKKDLILALMTKELTLQEIPRAVITKTTLPPNFMLKIDNITYTPSSSSNLVALATLAHPDSNMSTIEKNKVLRNAHIHKTELPERTPPLQQHYKEILNDMWNPDLRKWDLNSLTEHVSLGEMPQIIEESSGLHSEFIVTIATEQYIPSSMSNLSDLTALVHPDSHISNDNADKALMQALVFTSK
ncbi:MAG: hypothetical protein ACRCV3_02295 [Desulfovibrionaceae bacterium]